MNLFVPLTLLVNCLSKILNIDGITFELMELSDTVTVNSLILGGSNAVRFKDITLNFIQGQVNRYC